MRTPTAILGSAAFLLLAPGIVAGLIPWMLSERYGQPLTTMGGIALGGLMVALGVGFLLHAFTRFALDGRGTPAPIAPTQTLVVSGVYRHVRNPMYLAVLAIILGQALVFASLGVLVYALVIAVAFGLFVRGYEEPTLLAAHGAAYEDYCRNVPRWLPRLTPWHGNRPGS